MAPKFDNLVEHILKNILGIRTGHSIRKVLESKEVYNYDSFRTMNPTVVRRLEYEYIPATSNMPAIMSKLTDTAATKLQAAIEYTQFHVRNNDTVLADDPTKWILMDFMKWYVDDKPPRSIKEKEPIHSEENTIMSPIKEEERIQEINTMDKESVEEINPMELEKERMNKLDDDDDNYDFKSNDDNYDIKEINPIGKQMNIDSNEDKQDEDVCLIEKNTYGRHINNLDIFTGEENCTNTISIVDVGDNFVSSLPLPPPLPPEGIHTLPVPPKLPLETLPYILPPSLPAELMPYDFTHSSMPTNGEYIVLFQLVFQAVWCLISGSNNHSNILRTNDNNYYAWTDDNNYYAHTNDNNYYGSNIRLVY